MFFFPATFDPNIARLTDSTCGCCQHSPHIEPLLSRDDFSDSLVLETCVDELLRLDFLEKRKAMERT